MDNIDNDRLTRINRSTIALTGNTIEEIVSFFAYAGLILYGVIRFAVEYGS